MIYVILIVEVEKMHNLLYIMHIVILCMISLDYFSYKSCDFEWLLVGYVCVCVTHDWE